MSSSHLCHIQTLVIPTDTGFSSFDFTNIPQNFTDLFLTYSVRLNASDVSINSQFVLYANGIFFPSNIMGVVEMIHNNTTSNSNRESNQYFRAGYVTATPATENVFGSGEIRLFDYSKTGRWKAVMSNSISENNSTAANNSRNGQFAGLIRTNDGITRVSCDGGRQLMAGSRMSLYGVI